MKNVLAGALLLAMLIMLSVAGSVIAGPDSPASPASDVPQAPEVMIPGPRGCAPILRGGYSGALSIAIPDGGTMTSTLMVAGPHVAIWDLELALFITHTANADLDITLTSPAGTIVTLTTDNGGSFDNVFGATLFDDQAGTPVTDYPFVDLAAASPVVPEEAMDAFRGEDPVGVWTLTIADDVVGDTGTLFGWYIDIDTFETYPGSVPGGGFINNTATPIPDVATITSTIVVAGVTDPICYLDSLLNITHTFNADLDITLTSPLGTIVTLTTDNGGGFDNVFSSTLFTDLGGVANPPGPVSDVTYADGVAEPQVVPEEAMAAFYGQNANGTWTLTITDDAGADTGTLVSWDLLFSGCTQPTTLWASFSGSLAGGDPTQTGRLWRDGVASTSTCPAPKACPGIFDPAGARFYDSSGFINSPSLQDICVQVTLTSACTGASGVFGVAYSPTFTGVLCTNYLADTADSTGNTMGSTVSMDFNVPPGQSFFVIVHTVDPAATCANYNLTVEYTFCDPTANVLIYGSSMGAAPNEQTLAEGEGHVVNVVSDATWSAMSTAQFGAYDAIVFGDLECVTSAVPLAAAAANVGTWSAAVTGDKYIQASDPTFHEAFGHPEALQMIRSGVNFAALHAGTGLYASLGCYYDSAAASTPVPFLAGVTAPDLLVQGLAGDTIIISSPAHLSMFGLTSAGLSNWGTSSHNGFNNTPTGFNTLATASNGITTLPYISATCLPFFYGDLNEDGNINAGDAVIGANYAVGNLTYQVSPFTAPLSAADVNKSGTVNAVDFVILANYLVGNIRCLPTS